MTRVAALYVLEQSSPYAAIAGVDLWPKSRDARRYAGPWPVVAHPPCARWGRYWSGGPSARVRRELGDDGGCFEAALAAVRTWGGVLEHPEASHEERRRRVRTGRCQRLSPLQCQRTPELFARLLVELAATARPPR